MAVWANGAQVPTWVGTSYMAFSCGQTNYVVYVDEIAAKFSVRARKLEIAYRTFAAMDREARVTVAPVALVPIYADTFFSALGQTSYVYDFLCKPHWRAV